MSKKLIPAVMALALVTGCTTTEMGNKQTVGTLGGAVAGGVLGSQFGDGSGRLIATGIGTLLGAYAGSEVGTSLDRADELHAQRAAQRAYYAPVGETIHWNNPQNGHGGTITTTRDGYTDSGSYCREFQQTINVGGRSERAFGTACKQPDGTWKIVN